jgi:hypothetical protein
VSQYPAGNQRIHTRLPLTSTKNDRRSFRLAAPPKLGLQITHITYIIKIMTPRTQPVPSAAAVLEPSGVHFHTVGKAMERVTASLTKSSSSSSSVYAVMLFAKKRPQHPNILSATRTFFTAYKRGIQALSQNAHVVLTHPDMDHVHSLDTKDFGDISLYWGKATAKEVKEKIPASPGIYILISDLDTGLLKELDLPLVPKHLKNIPLVLRVPHHGVAESIEDEITLPGKRHDSAEETPGRDTLQWRKRFMKENPCLTSEQVAEEATSQATNRAAIGSRWAKERKIFSVRFEGTQWFPRFQFQDGRPIPAVAEVIEIFPEQASGWDLAYFFVTPNMNIRGHKPVELLKQDPARLVSLAQTFVHPADVF